MAEGAFLGSSSASAASLTGSTTYYGALGGAGIVTQRETTQANVQSAFRGSATLKNLRINVQSNAMGTSPFTIQVAGVNTALNISITGTTTGIFSDLTHTLALADGDLWNSAIAAATTAAIRMAGVSAELESSGQAATQIIASSSSNGIATSRFYPLCGNIQSQTTEALAKVTALEACTLSRLQAVVTANVASGTCNFTSRKNGAAGAQTAAFLTTVTGIHEDTTNSDSLAAGDTFDINKSATTGNITFTLISMKYVGGVANQAYVGGCGTGDLTSGATAYSGLFTAPMGSATEAQVQFPAAFAHTLSKMTCNVSVNGSSATPACTLVSRFAGATGMQTVAPTASTIGVYQDTTHSDSVLNAALMDVMANGANGTVTFTSLGFLALKSQATNSKNMPMLGVG